jgi:hypothetical protein
MRRLPMAFLAALATNGDTGTSRSHGSSLSVEPSDIILYQERGASERSSWLVGVRIYGIFIIQDRYVLEASRVISLRRVRALRLLIRLEIEPVA